jgi:hypothetical protein
MIIRPKPNTKKPNVRKATKKEITSIIIPPEIMEYNIPNGPKRTVKSIERPMFLVGIEMIFCKWL